VTHNSTILEETVFPGKGSFGSRVLEAVEAGENGGRSEIGSIAGQP